ncbi:hypothetical protein Q5P01_008261 [Channa striata]|uniref:Ig-like domain-containing protein n=1 Tax=Channa striata TaxID=64152 RepID=A0AA88N536_CHASR|nr:hypothetical protein Q5P01_008261 [Channa striata]
MWINTRNDEKTFMKACPAFLTFTNVAYLAGVTVELPCLCKPQQVQSVVWFFKKHSDRLNQTKALTDHHGNTLLDMGEVPNSGDLQNRFSIRLFGLLIFRSGPDDSGIYICGSAHKDYFYGYDLDIQEPTRLSLAPRLTSKNQSETLQVGKGLYQVFTHFQPWSVCDRCGVQGEQIRVGLCYIHSQYLHVRYRRANQTSASCGSGAVPHAFGHLKQSGLGAKLEVRSCRIACPVEAPPSSKLPALMKFLGHSSASLPMAVPELYLNHPADQILALGCPGAEPNMAVAWDQGSEPVYRFGNLGTPPPGLQVDTENHLVFNPARTQDSGVYHCWLQGRRAAKIHLLVYARFGQGQSVTSDPEFQTAVKAVLKSYTAMMAVFCLLLFGRAGVRRFREMSGAHVD